jgi:hypothetical protein
MKIYTDSHYINFIKLSFFTALWTQYKHTVKYFQCSEKIPLHIHKDVFFHNFMKNKLYIYIKKKKCTAKFLKKYTKRGLQSVDFCQCFLCKCTNLYTPGFPQNFITLFPHFTASKSCKRTPNWYIPLQ